MEFVQTCTLCILQQGQDDRSDILTNQHRELDLKISTRRPLAINLASKIYKSDNIYQPAAVNITGGVSDSKQVKHYLNCKLFILNVIA